MPNAISAAHKGTETKGGCLLVVLDIEFIFSSLSLAAQFTLEVEITWLLRRTPRIRVDVHSFDSAFEMEVLSSMMSGFTRLGLIWGDLFT